MLLPPWSRALQIECSRAISRPFFCSVAGQKHMSSFLKDTNTGLEQETESGYVPKLHSDWRRLK